MPEEPLGVSFPIEPTKSPLDQCVNVYWIDDLGPFAAKLDVVVVNRQGHELGTFDLDVEAPATERRTRPSTIEVVWERYVRSPLLAIAAILVAIVTVVGMLNHIRYYYRIARGKRDEPPGA